MRLTLKIIALIAASVCYGQFEIALDGNISVINSHSRYVESAQTNSIVGFSTITPSYTLKESYESRGGYGLGFHYRKSLGTKFEMKVGLDYTSVAFKRNAELIYDEVLTDDNDLIIGQPIGDGSGYIVNFSPSPIVGPSENKGETRLNHLTIPVYALYRVTSKLQIGVGIRNSILVSSRETILKYVVTNSNFGPVQSGDQTGSPTVFAGNFGQIVEAEDTSRTGFRPYQLIGSLMVSYTIWETLAIQGSFNQGLNGIYDEAQQIAGNARMRTVSLGVSYGI